MRGAQPERLVHGKKVNGYGQCRDDNVTVELLHVTKNGSSTAGLGRKRVKKVDV